ncbi:MAG TPA: hypothetical protein VIS76_11770, partial [Pseudomonadales bacterium]
SIVALRPAGETVATFEAAIMAQLEHCNPQREEFVGAEVEAGYESLRGQWHHLKDELLSRAANRQLPIARLNSATEGLREYLKMAEQLTKASLRLRALSIAGATSEEQGETTGSEEAA